MSMKEIIQKAIEGGYDPIEFTSVWPLEEAIDIMANHWEPIVLKPTFWQALGKALGWEKRITYYNSFIDGKENNEAWRLEWHRFIDHLVEGKDAESFFKELLAK